ncbi:MAG: molecular chaperone TorD family protein [Usitatibacter sp.]
MSAVATPVAMRRAAAPEDSARADFYALLARLCADAPDRALLAALSAAAPLPADGDPALGEAWRNLVDASSVMDPDAAREEYEALFCGMGKAAVSIYSGFYSGAPSIDHPRVRLQADLASFGLARRGEITEPEDHFAGLFEVMRVLAAGGAGREPAALADQKRFFHSHLDASARKFFAALGTSPKANYYRNVAALGVAVVALESTSFQLD